MDPLRIALWGPTGSGKTWLVHALDRELRRYTQLDPYYSYDLQDEHGNPVIADSERVPLATDRIEDSFLRFSRSPKPGHPKLQVFVHEFIIHDNLGVSTLNALGLSSSTDAPAEITLERSFGVVALLDAISANGVDAPELGVLASDENYAEHVEALFQLMNSASFRAPRKYLALCVSKVDQLLHMKREPKELMQVRFRKTAERADRYANQQHSGIEMAYFSTSAVGFVKRGRQTVANFNPEDGSILEPSRWLPYNVVAPFFWMFENVERASLSGKTPYRSYPKGPKYPMRI